MSTEGAAAPITKVQESLCETDLWDPINRLESVLDVMNEDMRELCCGGIDESVEKHLLNRIHNMLGVAQMLAGELAVAARVR